MSRDRPSSAWWEQAAALHASGTARHEIAARFGVTENMVGKALKRMGLTERKTMPDWHAQARELREHGATYQEIADRFEVSNDAAHFACNESMTAKAAPRTTKPAPMQLLVDRTEIRRLAAKGMPLTHIAASCHVPYRAVIDVLDS